MSVLSSGLRRVLESACTDGRVAAEAASRAALVSLAVTADRPPAHLSEDDRRLRRGLRAKARQLGDTGDSVELLVADCAYEQWHRLLFARFLAENNLLIHPDFKAPVTLADCDELAEELSEPDGWSVAARFASQILPGIFRLDDPCVQVRLAPEGRLALENIVADLPADVFAADDSLGWVYQFWQKQKKDEVNASERKIGGADLGPVTQLFTENYMVRFLLENSLGAWWAARRPDSPLIKEWEFLRFDDDGAPAAGSFDGWPDVIDEVTVMDPCCGSGHFLVETFKMLWRMRVEENRLDPIAAQDAVLRDNLFGLELDPRCVQIAMFAVALQAWKDGSGWRELPVPNIACSGIPVKAPLEEWTALANGDPALEAALERLHLLFRDADTLGSLIDPRRAVEITDPGGLQTSTDDVDWLSIAPFFDAATQSGDPSTSVLRANAHDLASASKLLGRTYTLTVTNVPYLSRQKQSAVLARYLSTCHRNFEGDLATAVVDRARAFADKRGTYAAVVPDKLLTAPSYKAARETLLTTDDWRFLAWLGPRAFQTPMFDLGVELLICSPARNGFDPSFAILDVSESPDAEAKAVALASLSADAANQDEQANNPDSRVVVGAQSGFPLLESFADSYYGVGTGDRSRYVRFFWELPELGGEWIRFQGTVSSHVPYGGRESVLHWEGGTGALSREPNAYIRNSDVWGSRGVLVSLTGSLWCTLFTGEAWDSNCAPIIPKNEADLGALWKFCTSGEFAHQVRRIDRSVKVMNHTLLKVPIDIHSWRAAAEPAALPAPGSDDPTQWLFAGDPQDTDLAIHVGVARLLGARWPDQESGDNLAAFVDSDGLVSLQSVLGEEVAAGRLSKLLSVAAGETWSPTRTRQLLEASGSKKKDLESWLRDDFFGSHCKLFQNRPFIWHIWDGRKDGFAALVNYHRLDRANLERLTYTYLGDWIERQTAAVRDDVAGAEDRLAAARALQRKLELILEGEPPYDIYVRWKELHDQPIGWDPDLNDGVRLNIRPFVEAGILRSRFNIHWKKDRGKNPDGSERHNDLHFTNAEKLAARKEAGV